MIAPTKWLIVGDSHVSTFAFAAGQGLIDKPCLFKIVGGATATGMRNPNSLTNAMREFAEALLPCKAGVEPVIHLGEVDCGFVIWWRAQKYRESVERQLDEAITAQIAFVDTLLSAGYHRVVLTGATLPTIRDGTDWGDVANLRREVTVTLAQRTALTLAFNSRIKREANRRGLPYIDISQIILDEDTGVIADRFRHPDPADHHLDPAKAGPLWAEALNSIEQCPTP